MTDHNIGVDISKSHLDVFRLEDGAARRFDNSAAGFVSLKKWLNKLPVARVVFEPTGPYHKAFEIALGERLPLVKVNPLQARRFAEAHGTRAKTDAVDAQMLARMGAALGLAPKALCSKEARILPELHVARTGLIKDRTRLRNRDILCSMPGIGVVTAAAMLTLLPEIGTLDRKQVASLAGLAPITRQSGQWQGKSFIGGGRKQLRDALYMPALVAIKHNPDLKAKYETLRGAGKPAKVAIVAVMRKLTETANALVKANRMWTQKTA